MSAVIARLETPAKEDGSRDRMYVETCLDAVVDPTTGKKLTKVLKEMKEPLASDKNPGLMSPTDKVTVDRLYKSEVILSTTDPDRECIWLEEIEVDEEP